MDEKVFNMQLRRFLKKVGIQSQREIEQAVRGTVSEIGATCLKDMGRTMAALREKYSGTMDFGKAGGVAKKLLG